MKRWDTQRWREGRRQLNSLAELIDAAVSLADEVGVQSFADVAEPSQLGLLPFLQVSAPSVRPCVRGDTQGSRTL